MRTKTSTRAAGPTPTPSVEAPSVLDQARAIIAASPPASARRTPVKPARLARLALLLALRLRLEPYLSRLNQLPAFVLRPDALRELEVLARALLALPKASKAGAGARGKETLESAAALRERLRRGLPRCFDVDDEVHSELSGIGRRGKRPLLDDLQRLDTALRARRSAWAPYPQFLAPADFEAIGPAVAALEAELAAPVDPHAELEPQLKAQLVARFRRARAIGLLVLQDGETAPPLPKLVTRKKKAKKKDGEDSNGAKAKAEAESKSPPEKKGKGRASAAPDGEAVEGDPAAGSGSSAKRRKPGTSGSATPSAAPAKPSASEASPAAPKARGASTAPPPKIESVEADDGPDSGEG